MNNILSNQEMKSTIWKLIKRHGEELGTGHGWTVNVEGFDREDHHAIDRPHATAMIRDHELGVTLLLSSGNVNDIGAMVPEILPMRRSHWMDVWSVADLVDQLTLIHLVGQDLMTLAITNEHPRKKS